MCCFESQGLTAPCCPSPLLQVYVGRQHHLAVEIGGQQFELTLNNQPTEAEASAGQTAAAPQQQALPMPQVGTAGLAQAVVLQHKSLACFIGSTAAGRPAVAVQVCRSTQVVMVLLCSRCCAHMRNRRTSKITVLSILCITPAGPKRLRSCRIQKGSMAVAAAAHGASRSHSCWSRRARLLTHH